MEETRKRGRRPIPIWIDGVKFDSATLAIESLNIYTPEERREFWSAVNNHGLYGGRVVRQEAPREESDVWKKMHMRRPGELLLSGLCVHRLGAYHGGAW